MSINTSSIASRRRLEQLAPQAIEDHFVVNSFSRRENDWCGLHASAEGFSLTQGGDPTHIHFYVSDVEAARALWRELEPRFPAVFKMFLSYSLEE